MKENRSTKLFLDFEKKKKELANWDRTIYKHNWKTEPETKGSRSRSTFTTVHILNTLGRTKVYITSKRCSQSLQWSRQDKTWVFRKEWYFAF